VGPQPFNAHYVSNWKAATAMSERERKDLIAKVLEIQRQFWQLFGKDATVQDVEDVLTGKRYL
jgi:hypothetical protein